VIRKRNYKISVEINGRIIIIHVDGYLNLDCGEEILENFRNHIDVGYNVCLLDMENVIDINSSGLSILIEIIEILQKYGGRLHLINIKTRIEKALNLMGIFEYVDRDDSIDWIKNKLV